MNTIALRTVAYTRKYEANEKHLRVAFWILAVAVATLAIAYCVLVNNTVLNVVSRGQNLKQVSAITSTLNQLQGQEVALRNKIDPDYAATLGFQAVANPQFMSVSSMTDLSYNTTQ